MVGRNLLTFLGRNLVTFLLVDDLLHHLTPGLGHQAALLPVDWLTDLAGQGDTLLVSVGLTVGGQLGLTLGLHHHLAVSLGDGGALLLVHSPALRLTLGPAGLLVHCTHRERGEERGERREERGDTCGAGWLSHCLTDLFIDRATDGGGGHCAVLLGHRGALLPVYGGADLGVHGLTDILTLGLVEAPVVLPVLGRHLQQLAVVLGLGDDHHHHQGTQQ